MHTIIDVAKYFYFKLVLFEMHWSSITDSVDVRTHVLACAHNRFAEYSDSNEHIEIYSI